MSSLLTVKDLSVSFLSPDKTKNPAVLNVDFSLKEGEIVALVGESGCGKSATAKSLLRLFPKSAIDIKGSVFFQGIDLLSLPEYALQKIRGKNIGMIFQDPMTSLNPTMRIGEQIIEGYRKAHPEVSYKQALSKAIDTLESVGMQDAKKRILDFPHTLSGGMKQRVLIAIAIISSPKLLIADEPTTALDVTVQAQVLSVLQEIQKKLHMSILLITHDLSVVAGFCDRVLVMYGGKVVESASVEDLFYNPQHPYTKKLLKAAPRINSSQDEPLIPIEGSPPEGKDLEIGCSFHPRCSKALPVCKEKVPALKRLQEGHFSRCFLHEEKT
jgi:oligopeptide transport system ATP-binding protein